MVPLQSEAPTPLLALGSFISDIAEKNITRRPGWNRDRGHIGRGPGSLLLVK